MSDDDTVMGPYRKWDIDFTTSMCEKIDVSEGAEVSDDGMIIEPKTDPIDPEIAQRQKDLYLNLNYEELERRTLEARREHRYFREFTFYGRISGQLDLSAPVWLADKPYRWAIRKGEPLELVPDYHTRAGKSYQVAMLTKSWRLCSWCGEYI